MSAYKNKGENIKEKILSFSYSMKYTNLILTIIAIGIFLNWFATFEDKYVWINAGAVSISQEYGDTEPLSVRITNRRVLVDQSVAESLLKEIEINTRRY